MNSACILRIGLLLVAHLFQSPANAAVRLPRIFSDGMILQRDQPVPVWGWADPGEVVTVDFGEQKKSVATDPEGKWSVMLDSLPASAAPRTMKIGSQSITNVLVGDVFQVSGQSNAAMSMDACKRYPGTMEDISNTTLPSVRIFQVPSGEFKETPQEDVPLSCVWDSLRPEKNAGHSAIAFYFARALQEHLQVPIGIVRASHGGGRAEIKMPMEALRSFESGRRFYENGVKRPKVDGGYPSSDWNGAIAPVIRFGKRGILWYQGEHNAGSDSFGYRETLPVLIRSWREACGNLEMPFLIVQLPAFEAPGWPVLRESQLTAFRQTKNAGFVVAIDHGERDNIHPADKKPIGERLALEARRLIYGETVTGCGPLFDGFCVEGGKVIVRFAGGALKRVGDGFTIAGEDRQFVPATAEIRGKSVVVSSPAVPNPKAVRYAWEGFPSVSLFDENGLPASPFRSDEWVK
jgi:sialate O-acetylesterase